jgi:uncharacterized protein (UPF0333 family)
MPEENNKYSLEENSTRLMIRRILVFILVIAAGFIIGYFVFKRFNDLSDAHQVLREAKNIKMSLEMIDREYYAAGFSIYDENAKGNIRRTAYDYVHRLQGNITGDIRLSGYNTETRTITCLEYEAGDFIVRYKFNQDDEKSGDDSTEDSKDETGSSWQVFKIDEILGY